jgi:hypothetical protein
MWGVVFTACVIFFFIYWFARESQQPRLWYLSNYHDALQAHMHPLHKLGNANFVANYQN